MRFEPEKVKGFREYLYPESLKRAKVREVVERTFRLFGFLPIETPIIEYDELMRSDTLGEEDEAIADRFRLKDKGGRNLGLRYEFTFQLARVLKENPNVKLPFKVYQIGPNFRDEPIRAGRTRQFTQCDVDIIGDPTIAADAECLAVVAEVLKELNIKDIEVQINNRRLLNEILESVQIKDKQEVMRELDKIDKIGEDTVKSNLRKYADTNQILTLFRLLEKDLEFFKQNAFPGAEELDELISLSKTFGLKTKFSPGMIRGFGYYTGNIFEITKGKTALTGGGRYNNSVGKYLGREIPAVGNSFSIESLMALCEDEIDSIELESIPKIVLISLSQDKETIRLAQKIRKEKISCSTFFGKPGKALDFANSQKIPFAAFIGAEEMKNKKFKLKDMGTGKETLLTEKQFISKLTK